MIWAVTWQNQQSDCAPSEDSDQPGHWQSLIRVFAVRSMGSWGPKLSSCGQRRFWSDWVDAEADLSLRWAHPYFVGFVMPRLNYQILFWLIHRITVNVGKLHHAQDILNDLYLLAFVCLRFYVPVNNTTVMSRLCFWTVGLLSNFRQEEWQTQALLCTRQSTHLSHVMKLWFFSSSIKSFFKHACAAIQWG